MHVPAAWIDEAVPFGVDLRRAARVIARVVGHGSGDDEDQAGTRVRVPAAGPSRRELVVDDIDVGLPVGLELGFPALRETRVGFEMELVEERLREDGGSRPVLGVARAGLTISAAP